MKNSVKLLVLCCTMFFLSPWLRAQYFKVSTIPPLTSVSAVTGSTLTALSVGSIINPGDHIVVTWASASSSTPVAPYFEVTAFPSGLSPTSYNWTLQGDIGLESGTGGSGSLLGFGTRNENSRGTSTDLGQSKGRVNFSWLDASTTCGPQVMSFDVFKTFNNTSNPTAIPAIIGPDCITPNTLYTYSVDPIMSDNLTDQIGLDLYRWDISSVTGASGIYFSTDSSSITFTTGATVPSSATITCGFGVANVAPWQTTGSLQAVATKNLLQGVVAPSFTVTGGSSPLTGPPYNECVMTNPTTPYTTVVVFTASPTTSSYTWASSTGLPQALTTPVSSGTGNSVYTITVSNNPGTITVTSTSTCGDQRIDVINVNRGFTAGAVSNFTAVTCVTPGTSGNTNAFIGLPNASLLYTQLTWSGTGGTVTAGSPTTNFDLNASAYPLVADNQTGGTGNIQVTSSAVPSCGATLDYPLSIRPTALTYSTFPCFAQGSSNVASIQCTNTALPALAACSYAWNIPSASGITAVSPTSMTSNVNATTTATSAINYSPAPKYTVAPGCSTSTPTTSIYISAVTPTGLTGSTCYNVGFSTTDAGSLTVAGYPGYGTYQFTQTSSSGSGPWLFSGSLCVVTGPVAGVYTNTFSPTAPTSVSGSNATFQFPNNSSVTNTTSTPYCAGLIPGTYAITVTHISGTCPGSTPFGPTNITVAAIGTGHFTEVGTPGVDDQFTASSLPSGYTFQWWVGCPGSRSAVPGTASITHTGTFTRCDLFTTAGSGVVYSVDVSSGGCTTTYALPTTEFNNRMINPDSTTGTGKGAGQINIRDLVKYYPNPTGGEFTVEVLSVKNKGTMTLFDIAGRKVAERSLNTGINNFSLKLSSGDYQLHLVVDDQELDGKMVITE